MPTGGSGPQVELNMAYCQTNRTVEGCAAILEDEPSLTQCQANGQLDGCAFVLKQEEDRKASEMAMRQKPFGGLDVPASFTISNALKKTALNTEPKLTLKADGTTAPDDNQQGTETDEVSNFQTGITFVATGKGRGGATDRRFFALQISNFDRTVYKTRHTTARFTPKSDAGDYTIDIFNVESDRADTRGPLVRARPLSRFATDDSAYAFKDDVPKLATLNKADEMAANKYEVVGTPWDLAEEFDESALFMPDDKNKWMFTVLKGKSKVMGDDEEADGTFYAEVWRYGASSDYMAGGVWLLSPKDGNTNNTTFAAFVNTNSYFGGRDPFGDPRPSVRADSTGKATYRGVASGLYMDNMNEIHRLLGTVEIDADFGEVTPRLRGSIKGRIDNLKLGGKMVGGSITLPEVILTDKVVQSALAWQERSDQLATIGENRNRKAKFAHDLGKIGDKDFMGDWAAVLTGPATAPNKDVKPTGVLGVVSGYTEKKDEFFAASFGAKEVKPPKESE